MRLIDLDALPYGRVEWEDIVDLPTVDAVPVEWIEQYKQSIGSQTLMGYRWIEKMQKAWAERREDD